MAAPRKYPEERRGRAVRMAVDLLTDPTQSASPGTGDSYDTQSILVADGRS